MGISTRSSFTDGFESLEGSAMMAAFDVVSQVVTLACGVGIGVVGLLLAVMVARCVELRSMSVPASEIAAAMPRTRSRLKLKDRRRGANTRTRSLLVVFISLAAFFMFMILCFGAVVFHPSLPYDWVLRPVAVDLALDDITGLSTIANVSLTPPNATVVGLVDGDEFQFSCIVPNASAPLVLTCTSDWIGEPTPQGADWCHSVNAVGVYSYVLFKLFCYCVLRTRAQIVLNAFQAPKKALRAVMFVSSFGLWAIPPLFAFIVGVGVGGVVLPGGICVQWAKPSLAAIILALDTFLSFSFLILFLAPLVGFGFEQNPLSANSTAETSVTSLAPGMRPSSKLSIPHVQSSPSTAGSTTTSSSVLRSRRSGHSNVSRRGTRRSTQLMAMARRNFWLSFVSIITTMITLSYAAAVEGFVGDPKDRTVLFPLGGEEDSNGEAGPVAISLATFVEKGQELVGLYSGQFHRQVYLVVVIWDMFTNLIVILLLTNQWMTERIWACLAAARSTTSPAECCSGRGDNNNDDDNDDDDDDDDAPVPITTFLYDEEARSSPEKGQEHQERDQDATAVSGEAHSEVSTHEKSVAEHPMRYRISVDKL